MSRGTPKTSRINKRVTVEISVVIVAVLSFVATVSAALINYFSTRYPIDQTLKATQKAEQSVARIVVMQTSVIPEATLAPLPTETATIPPTPSWTATSEPTPSPSPTTFETTIDWHSRFDILATWYPCEYRVIPEYIDVAADKEKAAAQVEEAVTAGEFHKWDLGPHDKSFILTLEITNISQEVEWIRLSKTASISVQSISEVPAHINMTNLWGCGGGGMFREFSIGSLSSLYKSYDFEVTYPDVDYFTLQQGEFESFIFTFECDEPGIYQLEIEIPFSQKGVEGSIVYADRQRLVCPQEFSGYGYLSSYDTANAVADLSFEGTFTWDGINYILKP